MSSVLSQSEVDSLLAALEPVTPTRALQGGVKRDAAHVSDRIGAETLRRLQTIHERFAVELSEELGILLAATVEVKSAGIDQLSWSECVGAIDNPGCLAVIATDPPTVDFLLEIDPGLAFPIVDRLLGGSGAPLPAHSRRPFTEIEMRLLSRFADLAGAALATAWQGTCELRPKVTQFETDVQHVRFAASDASIAQARFDVSSGEMVGSIHLDLSRTAIERMIVGAASSSEREPARSHRTTGTDGSAGPQTRMIVQLAATWLSPEETANLEVGDVIVTDCDQTRPLTVFIDGTPRFEGFPGLVKERKAVRIGAAISPAGDTKEPSLEAPPAGESAARD